MNLAQITAALERFSPRRIEGDRALTNRAAVAMVLGGPSDALWMCFILKTRRPGDQWSGQMALPGGWAERGDGTARSAAIREAHEEVGLRLADTQCLGALSERWIHRRGGGGERNAMLSPYVFYIGEPLPVLRPEPSEVADAYWIALDHLWHADNATTLEYASSKFPGIAYQGQTIWGLTLWVLESFRDLVRAG